MTVEEQIKIEFYEHGELVNSLKCLEYGLRLLETMKRHDCTLSELLNGINAACQQQVGDHKFSFIPIRMA